MEWTSVLVQISMSRSAEVDFEKFMQGDQSHRVVFENIDINIALAGPFCETQQYGTMGQNHS